MWHNLSYPSKTALALAQRLALYCGRTEIEALDIAIGAFEVRGNAWFVAARDRDFEPLVKVLNEHLRLSRAPIVDLSECRLSEAALAAIDHAHIHGRRHGCLTMIANPGGWKSISTDELVCGCMETDSATLELLKVAGLDVESFHAGIAAYRAESRRVKSQLNNILTLDPEDWLLME